MIERIMVNLDVVEALLFYWHSIKERNKVSELFIFDVMDMPGLKYAYDDEFTPESVRKALSAITNRESFSGKNKKEGRFYSNNLWMLEDLTYTDKMIRPLKKLNLQSLVEKIDPTKSNKLFKELEVIFLPLHLEEYFIENNKLIINFFVVKPNDINEQVHIGEKELLAYIEEKLIELINQ
ncbi:hypothetical protein [Desulfosporosinus sp. Sb-LF]|uniref:TDE2712 family protein n=1 Tax=Desulfosporosinus sp. Sb-LF TaxID=2560027 RepID=UPI00107F442A|nr:hypothetical protein [Desulfosporosinus sp. Sb-LF]TGE31827.1 hypothetical protein E4K68_14095 [Desulfosporosinus sp. Sb-LF]